TTFSLEECSMQFVSKSRSHKANRLGSFRPRVETLEGRTQPGSVLTSGTGLSLLGSALDVDSLGGDNRPTQNSPAHTLRLIDLDNGSVPANATSQAASSVVVAPYQVQQTAPTSSLTLSPGNANGSTDGLQGLGSIVKSGVAPVTVGATETATVAPQQAVAT